MSAATGNSDPVRWGILSTARINDKFLRGVQEANNVEVIAVASRDGERVERFAEEHDIPSAYDGYDELLADPDVEAVYIPLPNGMHVPWTLTALGAGKHVLCEKPLARRAADAERVFLLARELGLLVSEAFMFRHHPQTHRLRQLVDEGRIGELRAIRSHFSFHARDVADVRLSAELEGGALMDVGCYCVNASRMLAGEPGSVSAEQLIGTDGVDMRFAGVLRFANGVLAHFDAGLDFASRYELEVVGSEGTLVVGDPWHCVAPGIELRRDDEAVQTISIEIVNPYGLEAENFSAAIRGEAELLLGADDAIGQAAAIEALYASADRARTA